jgi:WhiB family redox-sensing transcriptional regulator
MPCTAEDGIVPRVLPEVVDWLMQPEPEGRELPNIEDLLTRPEWQRRAACRGMGTDQFFPSTGAHVRQSTIALCGSCPVHAECETYAVANQDIGGVWAGTTERDRRAIRKGRPPAIAS